jgi:hypothetical protein
MGDFRMFRGADEMKIIFSFCPICNKVIFHEQRKEIFCCSHILKQRYFLGEVEDGGRI